MKILVTGGCGFIGSNLIRYLLDRTDHSVVNIDKLTYAANPASLVDYEDSPRYEWHGVDIANADEISAAIMRASPEAVIHLAAETHVDRSIQGASDFVHTNLVGTFRLLEACNGYYAKLVGELRQRFRFIHVSTDEVYGSLGATGYFNEHSPYAPRSPYAATKAGSDHLVAAWHATYQFPAMVTHCSNNYGPYQFPEKLIPLMILAAMREQPLPVYGTGQNIRDWMHVEDHVRGLLAVLERGRIGETYAMGAQEERRNIDVVKALCAHLDQFAPRPGGGLYQELITLVTDRAGHDFRYAIDSTKVRSEIGWQPAIALEDGLKQTVQWYLNHVAWWQPILEAASRREMIATAKERSQ